MRTERKRFRFEILLEKLVSQFPKILLTNLFFAIPSVAVFAVFFLLNVNFLFLPLGVVFVYPFYAGVVAVMRNIVRGDKEIPVFQIYFTAIKDNFLLFLFHGAVVSIAAFVSVLSIRLYIRMLSSMWIFYIFLFICIIIVLFAFFASLYLPLMSVTVRLKKKHLYKNSLLMSYGEFKNNFFATIAIIVLLSITLTLVFALGTFLPLIAALLIVWILYLPSAFTLTYVIYIYDNMYCMVSQEAKDAAALLDAPEPVKQEPVISHSDLSSIDVTKLKNTDDYIFYNGKMIKQSVLLKMLEEEDHSAEEVDLNE